MWGERGGVIMQQRPLLGFELRMLQFMLYTLKPLGQCDDLLLCK